MPCRHLPICSEITLFVGQGFIDDGTGDQVKVGSRARLLDRGSARQASCRSLLTLSIPTAGIFGRCDSGSVNFQLICLKWLNRVWRTLFRQQSRDISSRNIV
jgi:hypothetical protein